MPQFSYRARNARGELVEGVLECADRAVAIHQIEHLNDGKLGNEWSWISNTRGAGWARLSLAVTDETLDRGLERLRAAFA